jgi:4-phytase/acid phosphatase
MKRGVRLLLLAALEAAVLTAMAPASAGELVLERVVVLMRHGVRSPTLDNQGLAQYSPKAWPVWPVDPANLTPRGRDLVKLMGGYLREDLTSRGLLSSEGCPPAEETLVYSDLDQRTIVTGEGLLDGLYPGCDQLEPEYLHSAAVDPLYHPVQAGLCPFDVVAARQAILGRIGGSLDTVLESSAQAIASLQDILQCCTATLCDDGDKTCTLQGVPSALLDDKNGIRLRGPIAIGSTISEIFVLEYAQGMPANDVGFGIASTPEAIRPLTRLHTLQFNLVDRTPYVAGKNASYLVDRIVSALREGLKDDFSGTLAGPKLTVFVGHDNNLASVAGLLGLEWGVPTFELNQTPVGSVMAFELLRDADSGKRFVRIRYLSQTMDQLREGTVLDRDHPPGIAEVAVPGCIAAGYSGSVCAIGDFVQLAEGVVDRACIPPSN